MSKTKPLIDPPVIIPPGAAVPKADDPVGSLTMIFLNASSRDS
jgi:hypothetical protein